MNADEVIEAWVTEVAMQVPRPQRNDVALELRELLGEELRDMAAAAGRGPDADMALELVRRHGRPADVAARYRPPLTIIDPADGQTFLKASLIGLATLWVMGLVAILREPGGAPGDPLTLLSRWWLGVVLPSVWWPGLLVTGFGLAAWGRRRWPQTAPWQPHPADHIGGGRAAMAAALAGTLLGLIVLIEPRWLLDVAFGGRAAPAAYEALTYTDTFRAGQGPALLALLVLNVPLFVSALATGRRPAVMRRVELELGLVTCAVVVWTLLGGPILASPESDRTCKSLLALVGVIWLASLAFEARRKLRPAPQRTGMPA